MLILYSKEELKAMRLALGMSCDDVAKVMYMTKQQISLIETGKTTKNSSLHYYGMILDQLMDEKIPDIKERDIRIKMGFFGVNSNSVTGQALLDEYHKGHIKFS